MQTLPNTDTPPNSLGENSLAFRVIAFLPADAAAIGDPDWAGAARAAMLEMGFTDD